jgi:NADH-quinone oxidoreductase subunit M
MAGFPLLSLIVWLPTLGALVLLAPMGADAAKRWAFFWSLLVFVISLALVPGLGFYNAADAGLQLQERVNWIPAFSTQYFLGVDGLSVWLVLLTTLMTPLALLSSWNTIGTRIRAFLAFMLMLETGMLGVFLAQDMFLFYIFWEWTLVPAYFLVGVWGSERRIAATVKFFVYTFAASIFMLLAIIAIYVLHGANSFSIPDITADIRSGAFVIDQTVARSLFLGFFAAFAVKMALWPFHSWLPDTYTEAPTAATVILAGVLAKMGGYGLLRFNLQLFPEASQFFAPLIGTLAVIGIIYGAITAFGQQDIKRLVAYSSVSHLGFVILGIFSLRPEGIHGAILQMVNHGLSTGALFLLIGYIYQRRNSRDIDAFGGLWKVMPVFGFLMLVVVLSSIGLPGLNGFIGEVTILFGTTTSNVLGAHFAAFALIGVVLSAVYLLWMFRKVMMGETNEATSRMRDLTRLEVGIIAPLLLLIVLIGMYPTPFFAGMNTSVTALSQQFDATPVARIK